MKKHEFKENDYIVFDSLKQRIEYMSIARANGYKVNDGYDRKYSSELQMRFREPLGFTMWVIGNTLEQAKIKPYDFLKLISQYEVGDEVEVLKDNNCGCSAKAGDIVKVVDVDQIKNGGQVTLDLSNSPFSTLHNLKLHKSISNKQTSTNNQKTTSMKKFKNRFAVTGSLSLIKAFAEELEAIGYKNVNRCNERFIIVGTYGGTLDHNEYGIYSSKGAMTETLYDLPKDWDRALAAAKETVEEQKTYRFGGKTWYLIPNKSINETPSGGSGITIISLQRWYNWYRSMPETLNMLKCAMPADNKVILGCTTGTLAEALAICKDVCKA